ncbi:MAG: glycosyltransferase family 4 protein [Saprospiraceae bacterium]|nr:glycosyltransferase family 4 protein [Saprospiraceae bacterium]
MAVLFITHKYPPAVGGMEKQSFELIQGFTDVDQNFAIHFDGKQNIILFFVSLRKRVHDTLRQHPEITTIHLNDGLMGAFFYLLGIKSHGKKVVITFHGLDVVFPLSWYQKYVLPKLQNYDAFICVSQATKDACLIRGFSPKKLFVVNNGVNIPQDYSDFNHETTKKALYNLGIDLENDFILLSIGRPVKRKGFSWFADEVMPLLDDRFKFVHIGNTGATEPYFMKWLPKKIVKLLDLFTGRPNDAEALIKAAKQNKNIILAGKVSDELKNTCIASATCMLMPNIKDDGDMEGFGLVALEASIQGKTVLAAGIEGITDAVHDGKNGYLLPSGDAQAWAHKIMLIAENNHLFDANIKKYTAEHFSWEKMVNGYRKVFDTINTVQGYMTTA